MLPWLEELKRSLLRHLWIKEQKLDIFTLVFHLCSLLFPPAPHSRLCDLISGFRIQTLQPEPPSTPCKSKNLPGLAHTNTALRLGLPMMQWDAISLNVPQLLC